MTLQSCLHTSIFFSKGLIYRFSDFSSIYAISDLHYTNASFSSWSSSTAVISEVHFGLQGIFKGVYVGFFSKLIFVKDWTIDVSPPLTMIVGSDTISVCLSTSNFFLLIYARAIKSSKEVGSIWDLSIGFLLVTSGAWRSETILSPLLCCFFALIRAFPRDEFVLFYLLLLPIQ